MNHGLGFGLALLMSAAPVQAKPTPQFEKGLELKKAGKFAQAARVFAGIVSKQPRDLGALEQLATLQGWLEKYDESIATWETALKLSPKNDDFRLGLARVLYWKKDYQRSSAELDAILKTSPKLVDAWTLLGDVFSAWDRAAQAREAYLKAQGLAPDDAELAKKVARTAIPKP